MRFLIDAQLPPALADFLSARGHQAVAVRDLGLRDAGDSAIWKFAFDNRWIILTKDEDFIHRALADRDGPPVVWLRIGNSTNRILLEWLEPLLPQIIRELEAGEQIIEVRR